MSTRGCGGRGGAEGVALKCYGGGIDLHGMGQLPAPPHWEIAVNGSAWFHAGSGSLVDFQRLRQRADDLDFTCHMEIGFAEILSQTFFSLFFSFCSSS